MPLKIVIPDPGLREYGGHHPAMITSLANSEKVIQGDIELDVYCNKNIKEQFVDSLKESNINLIRHFEADFYQCFYQNLSLSDMNSYIVLLSNEYLRVFNKYTDYKKELLFLTHTMNWEHAFALSAAIKVFYSRTGVILQHYIFLMFNPEQHDGSNELNIRKFLNFKLAFKLLNKQAGVIYFVGDHELKTGYQNLLGSGIGTDINIELHPCCFLNKQYEGSEPNICKNSKNIIRTSANITKKHQKIILFTGDVKVNKGFLHLPEVIERISKKFRNKETQFLIQYTLTSEDPELVHTASKIKKLVALDKRYTLIDIFLSDDELHKHFIEADVVLFNYDESTYRNQSSGILWLSALYQSKMLFLTDTWLNREAERLGCVVDFCSIKNIASSLSKLLASEIKLCENSGINQSIDGTIAGDLESAETIYRKILFQDLSVWLYNRFSAG